MWRRLLPCGTADAFFLLAVSRSKNRKKSSVCQKKAARLNQRHLKKHQNLRKLKTLPTLCKKLRSPQRLRSQKRRHEPDTPGFGGANGPVGDAGFKAIRRPRADPRDPFCHLLRLDPHRYGQGERVTYGLRGWGSVGVAQFCGVLARHREASVFRGRQTLS